MLRRLPTSRLLAVAAAVLVVLGGGTAIAVGAIGGSGATPPPKPLAAALRDALAAPTVQGVTARIRFTNRLIDSGALTNGVSPLLAGATGRLWASADGRLRLELQSDRGDAQVTSDGKVLTIADSTGGTAYRIVLPDRGRDQGGERQGPPSVQDVQRLLDRVARSADLSGPTPSNVAGEPAYTVRISPKHDGGLVGAAELAWAAANGTPLRAAIYASGDPKPVLELQATDVSFGPVARADLAAPLPRGAKVTTIDLRDRASDRSKGPAVSGVGPVSARLPFKLSAPDTLVGLPRKDVRLVDLGGRPGALVTYGAGLGAIAVLEQPAATGDQGPGASAGRGGLELPKVSIDGASGEELATALGTVVRFERDGVSYVVIGSVPPAAAEAPARAL